MVLLTLKNLQQQTFQVEIDITASVKELKEKIEKDRGKDYPAVGQKLIYAGKILQDDNKLESYSMDVNKFLVIMVTKPKTSTPPPETSSESMDTTPATTAPAADPSESSSSTTTTASSTSSTSTTSSSTSTTSATTTTTTSSPAADAGSAAASSAESLLVMGDEFNKMVENIMEMGYERRMVERALRASFNNPYTAVQYLVDGIPDNVGDPEPAVGGEGAEGERAEGEGEGDVTDEGTVAEAIAAAAAASSGEGGGGGGGSVPAGGTADDPLAFLRNQPQFIQMAQMMRTNPTLLDAFLQQIRTTNPGLLRAIQQNQEAFVQMINRPLGNTAGGRAAGGRGTGGVVTGGDADAPSGGGGEGGGGAGRSTTIMLTQQDRDAIDRLRALGNFPEELVVQAYFACEKNENLAAEFLFSQAWD